MKISIVIISAKQLNGISDFTIKQLERHFTSWASEDASSTFAIGWMKNDLVLETNSSEMVNKWLTIEQQYLNYMLGEVDSLHTFTCQDSSFAEVA
jgi:hypothetical protein